MIFMLTSISNLLNSIGIGVTGSVTLFAFIILIGLAILMFVSNIPSTFILISLSILITGMYFVWGGAVLHILAVLIGIITGAAIGIYIIKFFSSSDR